MTEGPHTLTGEDSKREYADERDMDRFWEVARLEREPARQWWYIPLILGLLFISIPWYVTLHLAVGEGEGEGFFAFLFPKWEALLLGLPLWIWIPLGCTLGLSTLTAFAILRFWRDGDSDSD